jgi:uncharacterized membrane protein
MTAKTQVILMFSVPPMLFALSGMLFTCAGNFFNDSPVQSTILIIVTVCMLGIGIGMYIHLFRCVAYAGVDYAYKEMEEKLRKPYTKADIQSLGLHKFDILSCKRPRAEEETLSGGSNTAGKPQGS